MSIKVMTMVFDRYHVGGSERLLALAMADHARDDGSRIWPSLDELARKTMQSRSTVQRQVAKMLASGWLERVSDGTGRGRTNEYRIAPAWIAGNWSPVRHPPEAHSDDVADAGHAEEPVPGYPQGGQNDTLSETQKGVIQNEKGVTTDVKGVIAMTPESSEPSMNHTPLPPGGGATGFDEVFAEYPNQQNRAKAHRRWERLAPDAQLRQTMLCAIQRLKLSKKWRREGGRYVPEFVTWLRNAGWQDAEAIDKAEQAAWDESRTSIATTAERLGMPAWDEEAFAAGRGENFLAYTARVRRRVEAGGGDAH